MFVRALVIAAVSIVLAMFIGQAAPVWLEGLRLGDDAAETGPAGPPARSVASIPPPVPAGPHAVALAKSPNGHVLVDAVISGLTVRFLVDTGATAVTLDAATAARLGLKPDRADYRVAMSTANGVIGGAAVRLSEIRIGDIKVRNVDAIVMPPGALDGSLLGMTFLNKLAGFQFTSDRLILTQ